MHGEYSKIDSYKFTKIHGIKLFHFRGKLIMIYSYVYHGYVCINQTKIL